MIPMRTSAHRGRFDRPLHLAMAQFPCFNCKCKAPESPNDSGAFEVFGPKLSRVQALYLAHRLPKRLRTVRNDVSEAEPAQYQQGAEKPLYEGYISQRLITGQYSCEECEGDNEGRSKSLSHILNILHYISLFGRRYPIRDDLDMLWIVLFIEPLGPGP